MLLSSDGVSGSLATKSLPLLLVVVQDAVENVAITHKSDPTDGPLPQVLRDLPTKLVT